MIQLKKFFAAFTFLLILLTATANAEDEGQWRLDGLDKTEVRNFRITSSNTSASAQLSARSFSLLFDEIKKETVSKTTIYMVDLRQESHGFANGVPVSWYKTHNHANIGKTAEEIQIDEINRLKSILGKMIEFVPLGNHDKATLNKMTMIVENEKSAAEKAGFKYVRFSATDQVFPEAKTVDEFIKFYLQLPKNHWLHFHCHAGHGRTTTFSVFYDILKYPDLTLEEIVQRQYKLGGSNLLAESTGDDWYSQQNRDRANKLRLFYKYVQNQRESKFQISWSEWSEQFSD